MKISSDHKNQIVKQNKLNFGITPIIQDGYLYGWDDIDYRKLGGFLVDYYQGKSTVKDGRIIPRENIAPIPTTGPAVRDVACSQGIDLIKLHSGIEQSLEPGSAIPAQLTSMVGYDLDASAIEQLSQHKMPINQNLAMYHKAVYPKSSVAKTIAFNEELERHTGQSMSSQLTMMKMPRKLSKDISCSVADIADTTAQKVDYPVVQLVRNVLPLVHCFEPEKVDQVEHNLKENLPVGSILVLADGEAEPTAYRLNPSQIERMQDFRTSISECYQPITDFALTPEKSSHVLVKVK